MKENALIGRKDIIDLPELELFNVVAKIDTGAYGNALHCHKMKVVEVDGKKILQFNVLDPSHPEYKEHIYHSENFRTKEVKSSIGHKEKRYVIKTVLQIFGKKYKTEFSLTNRKNMRHPILIGRKFLSKKFLVDVNAKNLSYTIKTQKK
ncbi:MAG: RimK/LysX family protein [Cyclobacteriaceae bacterium]